MANNVMQEITALVLKHGSRHMESPLIGLWQYFNATQAAALHDVAEQDPVVFKAYEDELRKALVERDIMWNGPLIVRVFLRFNIGVETWEWHDFQGLYKHKARVFYYARANRDGDIIGDDAEVFTGEGKQQVAVFEVRKEPESRYIERPVHDADYGIHPYPRNLRLSCEWFLSVKEYFEWVVAHPLRVFPGPNRLPPVWGQQQYPIKILMGVEPQYRAWMEEK